MSNSFLSRMGDALHALAGKKTVQDYLRGTDVDDGSTGATLVSAYEQSAWVYCCVSVLAGSIAQIPFRISRCDDGKARQLRGRRSLPQHRSAVNRELGDLLIEDGDVVELFHRPHPMMDRQMFMEMLVTWLMLRGEFFLVPLDDADQPVDLRERNPRVRRMLTLNPDMFWHVISGYDLTAWRYTGSPLLSPLPSEMLLPSEVIHSRTPNPRLFWRGLSPLALANTPASTDYAGEQFQKGLWINNADTGVIVTTDQVLDEAQRKAVESALRERKRKAGTADRPLFLFGGAKVEKPMLSMMDMQFLETRKFLRQEIAAIFKVPEPMLGFTADLNDGGAGGSLDAAKASFVESTLGGLCHRLECALAPIIRTFGEDLVGWFDIDSLPIMQSVRRQRWDTAGKMFALGVPLNDINANLDLGLPEYPWGKTGYLPFSVQPAGPAPELPGEDQPGVEDENGEENEDETKSNPFLRFLRASAAAPAATVRKPNTQIIWESHIATRRKQVKVMESKTRKVLNEYRGKTLAKLHEIYGEKSAGRLGEIKSLVDLIFSMTEFGQALHTELAAPMRNVLKVASTELLQETGSGDAWELPPKKVTEYVNGRTQPVQGVGGTVRKQLNTTLTEGLNNGETTAELAGRVKTVFNNLSDAEATRVARTEVNSAYNYSRHETMQEVGIEYKAWLSSHGPNVRPAHAAAENFYIETPIPVTEAFLVGGEELMYPGDPAGSLGNTINCQCIQLAAQKTGEDAETATFKIFGIGEMKFRKHENT